MLGLRKSADLLYFSPDYVLEFRNEGLHIHKSGSFIGFSTAPLW